MHILQRNAIELTLIDVGDAIVLTSLRRADRALQMVAKAHVCEATERQREKEERETEIWLVLLRYILKFNAILREQRKEKQRDYAAYKPIFKQKLVLIPEIEWSF